MGRLTSESEIGGVTLSYTYDSAGNRTKLTATGTESYVIDYTYNNVNQLTSETKTESGATETTSYTYDANGNMLSKTSPEGTQANTYNNLNQLVSSITAGVTSSYTYNVDGIRTSKTVGTATTDYILDGGNVVAEAQNGDVTSTYLRGANLLSTSTEDETSYYIFNAHGDVTGLTNGAQNVTKAYDYDAFGVEKDPSATDENPFRYCGEYFDKETGTYYLRARYYDPTIGRFTQQDTHWNTANMIYGDNPNKINEREDALGLKAYTYTPSISSIMQSGNLYVYGINNPIYYFDYLGTYSLPNWVKIGIGVAVIGGLAVATAMTAGTAAIILGAALNGAIVGGVSGAALGAITGGIDDGLNGAIDGACSGFMSGTIIGGISGAASAGINVSTSTTLVEGKAHGSILHKFASNYEAGKMVSSGQYTKIGLNKSLKKLGLNGGRLRPDVVGIGRKVPNLLIEVVSPKQSIKYIDNKMAKMVLQNPGAKGKVVKLIREVVILLE